MSVHQDFKDFLECIRLSLNPLDGSKMQNANWESLFQLAKKNQIEGLCWYGAERFHDKIDEKLWLKWTQLKDLSIYRQLMNDQERINVLNELEKENIAYVCLKGLLIQDDYPEMGMRMMCDHDIYVGKIIENQVDATQQNELRKQIQMLMETLGYQKDSSSVTVDPYLKHPFYAYEIHFYLTSYESEHFHYYENFWNKMIRKENSCEYVMKDEDAYIYMNAHQYKHARHAGFGIRALCDEIVFLRKRGQNMDWNYIEKQLKAMNLWEFERSLYELAECVFEKRSELNESQWDFVVYMITSGTYGNLETKVRNRLAESENASVFAYMKQRLFPSEQWIQQNYPDYAGKPYLMPVLLFKRLSTGLVQHPGKLISELKILKKMKK